MEDVSDWLARHQPSWSDLSSEEKEALFGFAMLWPIFEVRITGGDGTTANPKRITCEVKKLENYVTGTAVNDAIQYYRCRYFEAEDAQHRREALRGGEASK